MATPSIELAAQTHNAKEALTCPSNGQDNIKGACQFLTQTRSDSDEDAIRYLKDLFRNEIKPTLNTFLKQYPRDPALQRQYRLSKSPTGPNAKET